MSRHSRRIVGGPHELGQNFLVDPGVAARIAGLVPPGPVVELGPGDGALTRHLARRPDPLTVVELDDGRARSLRRTFGGRVDVVHGDMLAFRYTEPHQIASNVPFGITTPVLRHVLGQTAWQNAVLLLQWEVARKRAAVGGTTLLTASWWPWYEFGLAGRVPASAFRPRPAVDGGLLVVNRRARPLVGPADRQAYQRLVTDAFRGDRLGQTLRGRPGIRRWAAARPRDLDADDWAAVFQAAVFQAVVMSQDMGDSSASGHR